MKTTTFNPVTAMISGVILFALLALPTLALPAELAFPSRQAAIEALEEAVATEDDERLEQLLGAEYADFQQGQESDAALRDLRSRRFLNALREFHSFETLDENRSRLIVGAMAWPFPIPLVREGGQWHFDGAAGVEELRNRIVGANELNAISLLDLYATAQREYQLEDRDGDGVLEFAQRMISTPGKRDGLYWVPVATGSDDDLSPLEPLKRLADALLGGRQAGSPFLGYYFKILYGQGDHARAGAFDYVINGHLLGGFAMLAWPADYGDIGVMSFVINQDHVVYESDLGPDTAEKVGEITRFDPGPGWAAVQDD